MWILTGGDDQVHVWRQMLEQKGEGFVNRFGINHLAVVQDKDEIGRDSSDFVEQDCQNRLSGGGLRGLEHSQHPLSNIRQNHLKSSDEVSQEACGVVVASIQRQPGDLLITHLPFCNDIETVWRAVSRTGGPFTDQLGFTKAGGGRDEVS